MPYIIPADVVVAVGRYNTEEPELNFRLAREMAVRRKRRQPSNVKKLDEQLQAIERVREQRF